MDRLEAYTMDYLSNNDESNQFSSRHRLAKQQTEAKEGKQTI